VLPANARILGVLTADAIRLLGAGGEENWGLVFGVNGLPSRGHLVCMPLTEFADLLPQK
jgi:hypothetical protein